jgi:hypothetical protein
MDHFSNPINIKVDINYDKQQTLPSITLCTTRYAFVSKTQIREHYPDIHLKILSLERKYENCKFRKFYSKPYNGCEKNYFEYDHDLNTILKEIRNRNRINTTLEQLFDRTLHFNKYFNCKVYYRDGKVIDCLQIYDLVEINIFGKRFTYLNINQENDKNKSQEFFITKEDYIEFIVNYDNITDIVNKYIEEDSDLYLGIDSPNTCIARANYLPLDISLDYQKIFFIKTTFKTLERPYNIDCHHYNHNELYHSLDNCIEYCNLNQQN